MKILDLSAGNRAVWFNKNHPMATYLDIRAEVNPDIICDTRHLPESVGSGFDLVVWDPPHVNTGKNSHMSKRYGHHTTAEILDTVEKTSVEAHRVTVQGALMAFKWNTHDIRLDRVLKLMPQWEPLFGHLTKDGSTSKSQTYWVMLRRILKEKLKMSERNVGNWYREPRTDLMSRALMTKDRAQYILSRLGQFGEFRYNYQHEFMGKTTPPSPDGITEIEDTYIKLVWNLMNGSNSYHDAVVKISEGI